MWSFVDFNGCIVCWVYMAAKNAFKNMGTTLLQSHIRYLIIP